MQKAQKWLILLLVSVGLVMASCFTWPQPTNMPVLPLLALVFGCIGGGYACSQLDQLTGLMTFRVHIELSRHPKFSIKKIGYTKVDSDQG